MTKEEFEKLLKSAAETRDARIAKANADYDKVCEAAKTIYVLYGGVLEEEKPAEPVAIEPFIKQYLETLTSDQRFDASSVVDHFSKYDRIDKAAMSKGLLRMAKAGTLNVVEGGKGRKATVFCKPEAVAMGGVS